MNVRQALVVPNTIADQATSGLQHRVNGRHATFQSFSSVKRCPAYGFSNVKKLSGFSDGPVAFSASTRSICSSEARAFSSTSSGSFDEEPPRESWVVSGALPTAPPATRVSISGRTYAVSGTKRNVKTKRMPHYITGKLSMLCLC